MMIPLSRNLLDGGKNVCIKLQSRLRYIACANACLCSLSTCKKCIHVVTLMMSHAFGLKFLRIFERVLLLLKGGSFHNSKNSLSLFRLTALKTHLVVSVSLHISLLKIITHSLANFVSNKRPRTAPDKSLMEISFANL